MSLGFVMMSRAATAMPTKIVVSPPMTGTVATNSDGTVVSSDDGFNAGMTINIVSVLQRKRSLSERQVNQLMALLNQSGKRIFPFDAKAITPELIRNNITESGSLPGVGSSGGSTWFVVGTGRIEIYDDHAVFRADGSSSVVSVKAEAPDDTSPPGVPPGPVLAPRTVRGRAVATPVVMPAPVIPKVSVPVAVTTIVENGLSMLLSIFLLIAGIMVLRDSRSAARLHWIYIVLKIPLVLLSSVLGYLFWQSFIQSTSPAGPSMPMPFYLVMAFFSAAIALAYPLGLIFVLMSRGVRRYYGPVTE
jgi:hypothetical protein